VAPRSPPPPPAPPPPPPPPAPLAPPPAPRKPTSLPYTPLIHNLYVDMHRTYGKMPVTKLEKKQCAATMIRALLHLKSVSRSVVRTWCAKQPPGTRCSLNTVFNLVCENHHAEVPDMYYRTIRNMSNAACDLKLLSCHQIVSMYPKHA
jgi:hypothetical protein